MGSTGVANRWLGRLLGALFGLLFVGIGLSIGFRPIAAELAAAWQTRDWLPTKAWVEQAELESFSGGKRGRTYLARVRYRYEVDGQWFQATRVGLDETVTPDPIGDWQRRWHRRLATARDSGAGLVAYVNPGDPRQALLDRRLRWPMLLFRLVFAIAFGLVGGVALWLSWGGRRPAH